MINTETILLLLSGIFLIVFAVALDRRNNEIEKLIRENKDLQIGIINLEFDLYNYHYPASEIDSILDAQILNDDEKRNN
jgi:hypothetical protein